MRSELKPYSVITDGNMAGSLNSLVTVIQKLSLVSYTFSWSGTSPVGAVSVQVSNDYSLDSTGQVSNAGNFSAISFLRGSATANSVALTGNTGADNIVLPLVGAYAIRFVYTRTSGTGTLQAWVCGKVA